MRQPFQSKLYSLVLKQRAKIRNALINDSSILKSEIKIKVSTWKHGNKQKTMILMVFLLLQAKKKIGTLRQLFADLTREILATGLES